MAVHIFKIMSAVFVSAVISNTASAVTIDDFQAKSAQQLANLCRVRPGDTDYVAASQFCEGFMTGAYQYHVASLAGPHTRQIVCLPSPVPSRGDAASLFVTWMEEHPQYRNEEAVSAQFKWLTETWPCKE